MEIKGIDIRGKKESFGIIDISEKSNLNNITRKLKSRKEMWIMF